MACYSRGEHHRDMEARVSGDRLRDQQLLLSAYAGEGRSPHSPSATKVREQNSKSLGGPSCAPGIFVMSPEFIVRVDGSCVGAP